MPQIKLHQIISFTSEDEKHKAENLLSGKGTWLCSPNFNSGNISIELQIEKATAVDYIDIGNHNCAFVSVDVGMSSWPSSQSFVSLLPSVVLMNPADCRSRKNAKTVRMFKKDDLDKENICKKWDRIRVKCSQPFIKGEQFGLAFLKLYSQENIDADERKLDDSDSMKKNNLMALFTSKSPSQKMPESLQALEQFRINALNSDSSTNTSSAKQITSPISRAGKLMMARKHIPNENDVKKQKKDLELEALNFLVSMNLTKDDIHSLRVSHIRTEFESRRNKLLDVREKLIFKHIALDYSAERLRKLDVEEEKTSSNDVIATPRRKLTKFNFKRTGNSPDVNDCKDDRSTGLSRNNLALVDSVVTISSGKRKRNPHSEVIYSNENSSNNKNKKVDIIDSDDSDDGVTYINSKRVSSIEKSSSILGGRPVDKFGIFSRRNETQTKSFSNSIECPLCTELYSSDVIEEHASNCEGKARANFSSRNMLEECPVCENMFEPSELNSHVEECMNRTFPE